MPKIGIRQFIITLSSSQRTHTHQPLTPTRAFTSRLRSDFPPPPRLRGNSSSLPDPNSVLQTRGFATRRDLATPHIVCETSGLTVEVRGRSARSPVSTPRLETLSGLPGRRRGALTRRKLRNRLAGVKSPGGNLPVRTSPQVTVHRGAPKPSAVRTFSANLPV